MTFMFDCIWGRNQHAPETGVHSPHPAYLEFTTVIGDIFLAATSAEMICKVTIILREDRAGAPPFVYPIAVDKVEDIGLQLKKAIELWREVHADRGLLDGYQILIEKA